MHDPERATVLRWVRLHKFCADSGDTRDAIVGRLKNGHWLKGVHARAPEGSNELWVNLEAVNDWAAGRVPVHEHGKPKR